MYIFIDMDNYSQNMIGYIYIYLLIWIIYMTFRIYVRRNISHSFMMGRNSSQSVLIRTLVTIRTIVTSEKVHPINTTH